jgi:hypothetical protein
VKSLSPSELSELLVNVALVRPVFIWGPPGIGKTAIINGYGAAIGYDVVSMLGSQLAPEDLIGVPRIEDGFSVFAPPRMIAGRTEPFILFIDEFNASSPEVQKAFYSLITEQRLGDYHLPAQSIVLLAGNRAQDNAITRTVSSALMNRVLHVELHSSPSDWLRWATGANIHRFVVRYIETRGDHLFSSPPKTEEPFATPRSWHMLSDVLWTYQEKDLTPAIVGVLAEGTLSVSIAASFSTFVRGMLDGVAIDDILSGASRLPLDPKERDLLTYVIVVLRSQLVRELPEDGGSLSPATKERLHQVRRVIGEIAREDEEMLTLLFARDEGDGARNLPTWFLTEMATSFVRLAAKIAAEERGAQR